MQDVYKYNSLSAHKSLDNSYYSNQVKHHSRDGKIMKHSFYKSQKRIGSKSSTQGNESMEVIPNYHSFLGDQKSIYNSEHNVMFIDQSSDHSLPMLNTTNKSILDLFRSSNSPEPHKRMLNNLRLKKNQLIDFDKLKNTSQNGHRRSTTSENQPNVPAVEGDHYQLQQLSQYQELKNALKGSLKPYKGLINNKGLVKHGAIASSVDNIHINVDNRNIINGK